MPEIVPEVRLDQIYYDLDGNPATEEKWLEEIEKPERIIGYTTISYRGAPLRVFARYSGVEHGGEGDAKVFEVGVTGDPSNLDHASHHGTHKTFTTAEACLTEYNKIVNGIRAEIGLAPIPG